MTLSEGENRWRDIQRELFPDGIPHYFKWEKLNEIFGVLKLLVDEDLFFFMFPHGGEIYFDGVEKSFEKDCIEVGAGHPNILKPRKLSFHHLGFSPGWDFLLLETYPLEPSGVYGYDPNFDYSEELTEIVPGKYVHQKHYQENEYEGQPLPGISRSLTRCLKGKFALFLTQSLYTEYDDQEAIHEEFSESEFLDFIRNLAQSHLE